MTAPHLAVRRAVREAVADLPTDRPVLVACSGGADSLTLAAALAHVATREGRRAGGVSVDHGLQEASAARAREVASALIDLGLDPVEVIHVGAVDGVDGPEGNARRARFTALDAGAVRHGAPAILLGHTRDDQAETVLLGLARGSGARSLAGMAGRSGLYRRPLLHLTRATVRAALPEGLTSWDDPHNADPAYARARVRHRVLPALETELGPGIGAALARTADLLRADADALDEWADRALADCVIISGSTSRQQHGTGWADGSTAAGRPVASDGAVPRRLDIRALGSYPQAVRRRVLRRVAIAAGSPPTDLSAAHVEAVDALVTRWTGQVGVDLPGKLRACRVGAELRIAPPD